MNMQPKSKVIISDFFSHTRKFESVFNLDCYFLRLQYEGSSTVIIQGNNHIVHPGSFLAMPPGKPFELIIEPVDGNPVSDFYIHCDGEWVDQWWSRMKRKEMTKVLMDPFLLNTWKQINLEKRRSSENKEVLDYLLRILCLNLDGIIENTHSSTRNQSFLVYRMKNFVEEHATNHFTLDDVASHVDLSVSRTVSLFKSSFGKSIMQYAMDLRLSISIERMQYSKMTLDQIAETCGFGTYSYFYRCFKAKYGISPSHYRETHIHNKLI